MTFIFNVGTLVMKILFLNNYDMKQAWNSCTKGHYPRHHLWGTYGLSELGIDVDILPYDSFNKFNRYWRVQRLFNMNQLEMIALDQQVHVLFKRRYDVVYSACQNHTFFLSWLRRIGVFRKPIITTIHHPLTLKQKNISQLDGHDKFIVLSDKVSNSLTNDLGVKQDKVVKLNWGPDISFYGDYIPVFPWNSSAEKPVIVSAGKANRDITTLIESTRDIKCLLEIYGSLNTINHSDNRQKNVSIKMGSRNTNAISYLDMVEVYKRSQIIAIPLQNIDKLAGLTSLLDALAVGRPVIMTKNTYIDIDIEREGIGIWVAPGDVNEWNEAIKMLISNPTKAAKMGERARRLCIDKYNISHYTNNLSQIISDLSLCSALT